MESVQAHWRASERRYGWALAHFPQPRAAGHVSSPGTRPSKTIWMGLCMAAKSAAIHSPGSLPACSTQALQWRNSGSARCSSAIAPSAPCSRHPPRPPAAGSAPRYGPRHGPCAPAGAHACAPRFAAVLAAPLAAARRPPFPRACRPRPVALARRGTRYALVTPRLRRVATASPPVASRALWGAASSRCARLALAPRRYAAAETPYAGVLRSSSAPYFSAVLAAVTGAVRAHPTGAPAQTHPPPPCKDGGGRRDRSSVHRRRWPSTPKVGAI